MGRIEDLSDRYFQHISTPWQRTVSGAQRVPVIVYDKESELLAEPAAGPDPGGIAGGWRDEAGAIRRRISAGRRLPSAHPAGWPHGSHARPAAAAPRRHCRPPGPRRVSALPRD